MKKVKCSDKIWILIQAIYILLMEWIRIQRTSMTFFKILWIDLSVTAVFAIIVFLWMLNKINNKIMVALSSVAGIYMGVSLVLSYMGRMRKGYPNSFFTSNIIPFIILVLIFLQIISVVRAKESVNKERKILAYLSLVVMLIPILYCILLGIKELVNEVSSDRHDQVFDKDPNEWNDADNEYVDDLFEWIDEQDK